MKFCEGIVSGLTGVAAWRAAYPDCSGAGAASTAASRALKRAAIQAEIARLREVAAGLAGSAVLTLVEKRRFLAAVLRTPVGEVTAESPLAQEYKEDAKGVTVKLPCKLRALELDAKLAGDFREEPPTGEAVDALTRLMHQVGRENTAETPTPASPSAVSEEEEAEAA